MSRIAIVTNMPTGNQSELFGALARRSDCDAHVLFLRRMTPGRQWTRFRENNYPHTFVRELRVHQHFYLNAGFFAALRRIDPQLIVICQYAGISMQLAMYYARLRGIPWVFWSERPGVEHSELKIFESDSVRQFFRSIAMYPVRSWPSAVWAIGSRAQADYQAQCAAPCHNLPYYSDLSDLLAIPRERRRPGAVRFLYSGKHNQRKGVDLITRVIDRMAAAGAEFSISFMGDGPLKSAVLDLQRRYPEIVDHVGFKEMDEVGGVLAAHDVLLAPSRYDGWGLVVPEALAAGMPVISTDATGSAIDMIVDDHNGLLIKSGSAEAIERAVRRMITAKKRLPELRRNARKSVEPYQHTVGAERIATLARRALENAA